MEEFRENVGKYIFDRLRSNQICVSMITIPPGYINVAAIIPSTHALGPGERAVVWVQGCPFHCSGCIAPEWLPFVPAHLMPVEELVDRTLIFSYSDWTDILGG